MLQKNPISLGIEGTSIGWPLRLALGNSGLCPGWLLAAAAVVEQADVGIETQRKSVDAASGVRHNKVLVGLGRMIGNKGGIGTKEDTFVSAGCRAMNSQG